MNKKKFNLPRRRFSSTAEKDVQFSVKNIFDLTAIGKDFFQRNMETTSSFFLHIHIHYALKNWNHSKCLTKFTEIKVEKNYILICVS